MYVLQVFFLKKPVGNISDSNRIFLIATDMQSVNHCSFLVILIFIGGFQAFLAGYCTKFDRNQNMISNVLESPSYVYAMLKQFENRSPKETKKNSSE